MGFHRFIGFPPDPFPPQRIQGVQQLFDKGAIFFVAGFGFFHAAQKPKPFFAAVPLQQVRQNGKLGKGTVGVGEQMGKLTDQRLFRFGAAGGLSVFFNGPGSCDQVILWGIPHRFRGGGLLFRAADLRYGASAPFGLCKLGIVG